MTMKNLVIAHSGNPPLLQLATASLQRLCSHKHQGHIYSYTKSLTALISTISVLSQTWRYYSVLEVHP